MYVSILPHQSCNSNGNNSKINLIIVKTAQPLAVPLSLNTIKLQRILHGLLIILQVSPKVFPTKKATRSISLLEDTPSHFTHNTGRTASAHFLLCKITVS